MPETQRAEALLLVFVLAVISVTIQLIAAPIPIQFLEPMPVKKGDIVRAIPEKLENSLEAQASDRRFPPYIFETKGEVLDAKGDYVLVKFGYVPTPNFWLRSDQLEKVS